MKPSQNTIIAFYQNLGKLFYAIAAADKKVRAAEINTLKKIVKKEWLAVDSFIDEFNTDAAYQIEIVFDWLLIEQPNAETCYNDFLEFKQEHGSVFTENIKHLILKTSRIIAASFSGVNKSELILLAKLNLEFKKT